MIGRLLRTALWLLLGALVVFGLYWLLLNTPESNALALISSAILVVLIIAISALFVNTALGLATGAPLAPSAAAAARGIHWVVLAAVPAVLLWWAIVRADRWVVDHAGEINAWFIARYGWSDISSLFRAEVWVSRWLRWSLIPLIALALAGALLAGGVAGVAGRWRRALGLRSLAHRRARVHRPRRPAAAADYVAAAVAADVARAGGRRRTTRCGGHPVDRRRCAAGAAGCTREIRGRSEYGPMIDDELNDIISELNASGGATRAGSGMRCRVAPHGRHSAPRQRSPPRGRQSAGGPHRRRARASGRADPRRHRRRGSGHSAPAAARETAISGSSDRRRVAAAAAPRPVSRQSASRARPRGRGDSRAAASRSAAGGSRVSRRKSPHCRRSAAGWCSSAERPERARPRRWRRW